MPHKVLLMPELVFRIGLFLPSGSPAPPEDIVSCIRVCRLWRDVFTPLLWMEYRDYPRTHKIPETVLHANSKHIRYLILDTLDYLNAPQITKFNALLMTRLKNLSLQVYQEYLNECLQILNINPGLSSLTLLKYNDFVPLQADDVMALLKPLTALQSLTLNGNLPLQPVVLKNVLDSNQRLDLLSLYIDSFETDPVFDDWGIYPSLKHLTFQCNRMKLTYLFRLLQHCPNMEALCIDINFYEPETGPSALALVGQILQEHCRKVKTLTLNNIADTLAKPSLKTDLIGVIQATNNLVKLALTMDDDFSTAMCDSLLHGSAHSLEVMNLEIVGISATKESIVSTGRVLSSCPELRHFSLFFDEYPEYSQRNEEALAGPWICSKLKTLTLRSNYPMSPTSCPSSCKGKTSDNTCPIEVACATDIEKQGWVNMNPSYQSFHISPTRQKHRSVTC
ncbi:hypothetical protein BGZ94_003560 [Podila epigama]|nr:hypothetical protein BGZ94_003560 [Podila epigama]